MQNNKNNTKHNEAVVKRKDKNWTVMEVEFKNEEKEPNSIYEFQSPRQLERWLQEVISDAYNISTEHAAKRIVGKVLNRDESHTVAKEVSDYIMTTTGGWFSVNDICVRLQLTTRNDRKNVVVCLLREKDKGIIIPSDYKNGSYRRIMAESEVLNWKDAAMKPLDIKWPFGLESLVDIYPTNIVVVAGEKDAGKTTFMFNVIKLNQNKYNIHYHTSEMAEQELNLRLSKFEDIKKDDWNFTPYLRSSNYADAIIGKEDDIVIFDFLELHDQHYKISGIIAGIHKRLKKGICIIAIQKSTYKELGRGADYSLEKARLYLTLQSGKAKIISGKNWHNSMNNPNGMVQEFKIIQGAKIIEKGIWHIDEDDPFGKKQRRFF